MKFLWALLRFKPKRVYIPQHTPDPTQRHLALIWRASYWDSRTIVLVLSLTSCWCAGEEERSTRRNTVSCTHQAPLSTRLKMCSYRIYECILTQCFWKTYNGVWPALSKPGRVHGVPTAATFRRAFACRRYRNALASTAIFAHPVFSRRSVLGVRV
jgi:hypothetical protein